ncbi:hypothetical protein DICA3_F00144 [Diutina catenulata]
MGYPSPLTYVTRRLSDNILVASTPFTMGLIPIGARMVLFKYGSDVVVWSPIPYGPEFKEILSQLGPNLNVSYVIITNAQHCMTAHLYRSFYPKAQIIAAEGSKLKDGSTPDWVITGDYANRVLDQDIIKRHIGIRDPVINENFEFVYLSHHQNGELVVYEKNIKTIFVGDVMFNLPSDEQGAGLIPSATGYVLSHRSIVGKTITNFFNRTSRQNAPALDGIRAVLSLPFERVVMCHGEDLVDNARETFRGAFPKL